MKNFKVLCLMMMLSLPVAGEEISLKMEKQFSGNRRVAVTWEPHSLVSGFGFRTGPIMNHRKLCLGEDP